MPLRRDPQGRVNLGRLEIGVVLMIFASAVAFSLETLPDLSPVTRLWLSRFELFSVILFSVEYLIRVFGSKPRLRYAMSFFGLMDLMAVSRFI